jgi:hypothetical protein
MMKRLMNDEWERIQVERTSRDIIQGSIPEFAWKDWRKSRNNSAKMACLRANTRTREPRNTEQRTWPRGSDGRREYRLYRMTTGGLR